jgi:hypothetical protein
MLEVAPAIRAEHVEAAADTLRTWDDWGGSHDHVDPPVAETWSADDMHDCFDFAQSPRR